MPEAIEQISLLRTFRSVVERYLALVAKDSNMHATDTSALSHLLGAHRRGDVLSAGELGELLSLSGPATTAAIDRLEGHGLVERRQSTSDGRRVEIHLTPGFFEDSGTRTIFRDAAVAMQSAFAKHSAAEIATFMTVMQDVCDAMSRANDERAAKHH